MTEPRSPRDDFWGTPIHTYLVSDALRDGVMLQPYPDLVAEAGYRVPLVFTQGIYASLVAWSDDDPRPQDETGRMWDVLTTMRQPAQRAAESPGERFRGTVLAVPRKPGFLEPQLHVFDVVFQALNRDGDPCLTILGVHED